MARRRSILKTLGLSMTSVSALGSLGSTVAAGEFTVGQRVATTVDLSVRSRPSLFASRREVAPEGATGYVRDGPREANGYTWWKIGYNDGYEGWSAEQYLTPAPLDDGSSGTTIEDSVRRQGEKRIAARTSRVRTSWHPRAFVRTKTLLASDAVLWFRADSAPESFRREIDVIRRDPRKNQES